MAPRRIQCGAGRPDGVGAASTPTGVTRRDPPSIPLVMLLLADVF